MHRALRHVGTSLLTTSLLLVGAMVGMPAMAATVSVKVVDQSGAAVDDAVVWAIPSGDTVPPTTSGTATIDQVKRKFVPLISVVQTGTSVTFPNKDDFEHDVYSFSDAKKFDLHLYHGLHAKPVVFDKSGLVVMGCNIHDQMLAYLMVVDTPYFAKTDKTGSAQLMKLPQGAYTLTVWHYQMTDPNGRVTQPLTAGAANTTSAASMRVELKPSS
ncbi:hypothetical protein WM40_05105 [Robbsia andropogonis]|uniref:Methylamine utilization protein n=2 Tax=Robbsia andropogonis TaxID=28092 RepID=A0A0F5K5K1_9BURK|nr:hypothetical protein WM40_05105 [Robbsia andropogonis]